MASRATEEKMSKSDTTPRYEEPFDVLCERLACEIIALTIMPPQRRINAIELAKIFKEFGERIRRPG